MNGQQKHGPKTENGRLSIAQIHVTTGVGCFSPVLPAEREADWLAILDGVRERIRPADRLEEEMVYNLAMALWQSRRLDRYEKAATHRQIEEAADGRDFFGSNSDAMSQLLARGVESVKAEFGVMEHALGLVGAVAFARDDESLSRQDGELLLGLAVELVLKGKTTVREAFDCLPEDGWTYQIVRTNLTELCEVAGKSMTWLLKALSDRVLEQLASLRETLEEGVRSIETNYILRDGETERLLLYHSRIQNRIAKWLSLLAQSKADRLGLTLVEPVELNVNGVNGDGALE
jgi:hypothetical protein